MDITFRVIYPYFHNCFTACFTVEFTIATDTPIYDQCQAVFCARRAVIIISENRPGDEASPFRSVPGFIPNCKLRGSTTSELDKAE